MTERLVCILDYETYSEALLKDVGAFEYSVHPSTEILCAAFRVGPVSQIKNLPTYWWSHYYPGGKFGELYQALMNPNILIIAHNAYFEQVITRNVFAAKYMYSKKAELEKIPIERWLCTASLARALALPGKLEKAAMALDLPVKKDMGGHRLMMKMSRPKKPTKKDPSTRHLNKDDIKRLIDYCVTDIDTEVELLCATKPLPPRERKIWVLDQKINFRGFAVDRPLVKTIQKMVVEETTDFDQKTLELTDGVLSTTRKVKAVSEWLQSQGSFLSNLQKATIEDAIKNNLVSGKAKTLLEYRQAVSKTSVAKYDVFERRSRHDGRLRDNLLYHGASTGRWTGMGIQPQNLPKASIRDTNQAAEICAQGDRELIRMLYGEPLDTFSDCIRGMIVAPPGKILDVADYNAIELRVCFWLAKHEKGLKALREGRDLYKEQAAVVFRKLIHEIAKDSFERFIGKGLMLGCQYGMGGVKFAETVRKQGYEIEDSFAKTAVTIYRETNAPIPMLWQLMERAAVTAVQNPTKKYSLNYVSWFMEGRFLCCQLPSGRRLWYYGPEIKYEHTPWQEKKPVLYHMGVNSISKNWELQKTWGGILVENIVQAISRDIMADAMLRIEGHGAWQIILTVHDELAAERDLKAKSASLDQFCKLMAEVPEWAPGCPITVEGWSGLRYRK